MANAAAKPAQVGKRTPPKAGTPLFGAFENRALICFLLIALTAAVYWPVRTFEYVNYDDADYVSANSHVLSGVSEPNLVWAFTTGHASNWHPLTWLSHQLDCQLFGSRPGAEHVVNLAFHALNAALLFLVLRRMTGAHWPSAIVAALFALHPLRVESVAWISERKDVLSGCFFVVTLGAYSRYVELRREAARGRIQIVMWYCLCLFCFALGLMSKPMLVTVPFLLLVLDYWPFRRWEMSPSAIKSVWWLGFEKVPFLLLAVASSVITFLVQRKGGAVSTVLSVGERVSNALISYVRYLGKTIWPVDLSVLYPHPGHWPIWQVIGAGAVLIVISGYVLSQARGRPYLVVGWLWFLGMLVPVIGLVQVGMQSMADRYTYLPSIGLFIGFLWAARELPLKLPSLRIPVGAGALTAVAVFAAVTAHQVQFWHDSETLFGRAIEVTSNNFLAYNNLGYYLSGKGKVAEAKEYYQKSLAINPQYSDALNNLGFALAGEGKYAQAIPLYEAALRVSPNQPEIHNNLGNALSESGHLEEAIGQYEIALKENPEHAEAHNNLGIALAMQGRLDAALEQFRLAVHFKPDYASAHSNFGNALAALHKPAEATAEYEQALRFNPNDSQAHNNLANVLVEQGRFEEAIRHYNEALRLKANNPEAQFNLAIAYLRSGRRNEAAVHFREVLRLNPEHREAKRQLELLSAGQ